MDQIKIVLLCFNIGNASQMPYQHYKMFVASCHHGIPWLCVCLVHFQYCLRNFVLALLCLDFPPTIAMVSKWSVCEILGNFIQGDQLQVWAYRKAFPVLHICHSTYASSYSCIVSLYWCRDPKYCTTFYFRPTYSFAPFALQTITSGVVWAMRVVERHV